ncbi:hypothetical protein HYH02_006850 [Chlamydomonas schloesseri]|uniref:Phosphatidate cytidylyltransferase n=1 Tax=Chlamydomonas schloesseri TaxID=2026947 RepID=A0A836B5I4_9CHLO|nr:hypothetical protein HYH02_006850 [Chlamydomonas schloesseri]|eukprot:KAG2448266.1 hypothetical protein HYH02_006850 [Chlamydomonas schloesseri]
MRPKQQAQVTAADDTASEPEPEPKPVDRKAKLRSFRVRTISSVALIGGFIGVIWSGHVPLMFFILLLQFLVARELFRIAYVAEKSKRSLPLLRTQQWYFFFTAVFWLYLRFIKNNLLVEVTSDMTLARLFVWALKHHSLISYSLYMAGFVGFVLSLKKGLYLHQFAHYAWTHMIILITTVPTSFFVSNIFSGILWYVLPAFLIVANDICAYLAGFFFGRTPLIKLSPKKTWEGFIGGFVCTLVIAFYLSAYMSKYKWMTCPRKDLTVFKGLDCTPDDVFIPATYTLADVRDLLPPAAAEYVRLAADRLPLPPQVRAAAADFTFTVAPIQLHALSLAAFASIAAPFGGFFASGFKRAFHMKDFGDTIPGHGGVTDRFDCQIVMAVFAYSYYWSYISKPEVTLGDVLNAATKLNDHDQILLVGKMANLLAAEGLIPGSIVDALRQHLGNHFTWEVPDS